MSKISAAEAVEVSVMEDLDQESVQYILGSPPFVSIDGVFNARDLGGDRVRKNYVYRSGSIKLITDQGKQDLVGLGIKRIFDLRSALEFDSHPDPEIDGIELTAALTITDPALNLPAKYSQLAEMYVDLLETHKSVWTSVFEHIQDRPEEPFLMHCTAGKDRTGTIAALIHGIAKSAPEVIAHDYALTRVGIEPVKPLLMAKLTGGRKVDLNTPHMQMVSDMSPGVMLSFLQLLDEKYGSVESYVEQQLEFSKGEIEQIRNNLRR